jgi:hypothetical protein
VMLRRNSGRFGAQLRVGQRDQQEGAERNI